jgi:hypothetical protein
MSPRLKHQCTDFPMGGDVVPSDRDIDGNSSTTACRSNAINFRNRIWLPATKTSGMAGFRFHVLRHTAGTLASTHTGAVGDFFERRFLRLKISCPTRAPRLASYSMTFRQEKPDGVGEPRHAGGQTKNGVVQYIRNEHAGVKENRVHRPLREFLPCSIKRLLKDLASFVPSTGLEIQQINQPNTAVPVWRLIGDLAVFEELDQRRSAHSK